MSISIPDMLELPIFCGESVGVIRAPSCELCIFNPYEELSLGPNGDLQVESPHNFGAFGCGGQCKWQPDTEFSQTSQLADTPSDVTSSDFISVLNEWNFRVGECVTKEPVFCGTNVVSPFDDIFKDTCSECPFEEDVNGGIEYNYGRRRCAGDCFWVSDQRYADRDEGDALVYVEEEGEYLFRLGECRFDGQSHADRLESEMDNTDPVKTVNILVVVSVGAAVVVGGISIFCIRSYGKPKNHTKDGVVQSPGGNFEMTFREATKPKPLFQLNLRRSPSAEERISNQRKRSLDSFRYSVTREGDLERSDSTSTANSPQVVTSLDDLERELAASDTSTAPASSNEGDVSRQIKVEAILESDTGENTTSSATPLAMTIQLEGGWDDDGEEYRVI